MRFCLAQAGIVMDCRDLSVYVFLLSQLATSKMSRNQNGCHVKTWRKERIEAERASFSLKPLLLEWLTSLTNDHKCIMKKKADPGGCPWGLPGRLFPQHTISTFGESTRQLEGGYDWRMALDFGLRKLDIFWPYCAEEKELFAAWLGILPHFPVFAVVFVGLFGMFHTTSSQLFAGVKQSESRSVFFFSKEAIISLMRHQLEFYIDFLSQILWVEQKCTKLWIGKRCLQKCVSP